MVRRSFCWPLRHICLLPLVIKTWFLWDLSGICFCQEPITTWCNLGTVLRFLELVLSLHLLWSLCWSVMALAAPNGTGILGFMLDIVLGLPLWSIVDIQLFAAMLGFFSQKCWEPKHCAVLFKIFEQLLPKRKFSQLALY